MFKNSVIKLFNPRLNRRGSKSQFKLVHRFKNSSFQEKRPRLITISKIPSKLKKVSIIFVLKVINLQSFILKRRTNLSSINFSYALLHNITSSAKIFAPLLNLLKNRNMPFIHIKTTRNETSNHIINQLDPTHHANRFPFPRH